MDVIKSHVWFTDLWNYFVVSYLAEAVRQSLQVQTACFSVSFDFQLMSLRRRVKRINSFNFAVDCMLSNTNFLQLAHSTYRLPISPLLSTR